MVRVSGPLRVVTDRPLLVSQVRVRAARDRAEQGGLTAAFDDSVPVTDGQLDMQVLPGPAVMMLEVTGGFSRVVNLVVPDVPEATLEQCVTAAQVAGEADRRTLERLAGEVVADRDEVRRLSTSSESAAKSATHAASRADTSADAAEGSARDAADSATTADEAASAAGSSAAAAAASERNAGDHASEAARAEVAAQGHEDAAAVSARDAAGSAERAATIAGSTRWVGTRLEVNGALSQELMPEITISDGGTWVVEGVDTGVRAQGEQGPPGEGASTWDKIAGKPTTFTPSVHSHTLGDVNGLLVRFGPGSSKTPKADGKYSTALGDGASASGGWGMALGNSTSAGGTASAALGYGAKASADFAQALTAYSKATKNRHTVIGIDATDENIPTDVQGTVVIGKTGVPVYLAGRDVLSEIDGVREGVNSATYSATPHTLMKRTSTGAVSVADPTAGVHAANKNYVDTAVSEARAYTDALIVEGNTGVRDGKLHIVYE